MVQTKVKEIDFSVAVGCFVPSIHKLESELPANLRLGVMTYLQKFPLLWQENFIIALKIRKKLLYNILVTKSQHRSQQKGDF